MCAEFEEAAELLSADPGASTLSVSTLGASTAGEDVKLDVSEDEQGQEESSEVKYLHLLPKDRWSLCHLERTAAETCLCFQLLGEKKPSGGFWTFEYYQSFFNVDTLQV